MMELLCMQEYCFELTGYLYGFRRYVLIPSVSTALPVLLAHSGIILWYAAVMSIVGGVLIYGTIIAFGMFFEEEHEF